jgi:hypothetical protein
MWALVEAGRLSPWKRVKDVEKRREKVEQLDCFELKALK